MTTTVCLQLMTTLAVQLQRGDRLQRHLANTITTAVTDQLVSRLEGQVTMGHVLR